MKEARVPEVGVQVYEGGHENRPGIQAAAVNHHIPAAPHRIPHSHISDEAVFNNDRAQSIRGFINDSEIVQYGTAGHRYFIAWSEQKNNAALPRAVEVSYRA
jgi:hypothetical protein